MVSVASHYSRSLLDIMLPLLHFTAALHAYLSPPCLYPHPPRYIGFFTRLVRCAGGILSALLMVSDFLILIFHDSFLADDISLPNAPPPPIKMILNLSAGLRLPLRHFFWLPDFIFYFCRCHQKRSHWWFMIKSKISPCTHLSFYMEFLRERVMKGSNTYAIDFYFSRARIFTPAAISLSFYRLSAYILHIFTNLISMLLANTAYSQTIFWLHILLKRHGFFKLCLISPPLLKYFISIYIFIRVAGYIHYYYYFIELVLAIFSMRISWRAKIFR